MGDVADMMEKQMPFEDDKLNRLVIRAASSVCTAVSLEHQVRRAAVMKRAKLSFINNMGSSMAGIGFDMVSAVSNFFESVADYDEATVEDKVMMVQIWDAMANTSAVTAVVNFVKTEDGKKVKEEEKKKKEEEKKKREEEKKKEEEEKKKRRRRRESVRLV